jgi:hypothetical protein
MDASTKTKPTLKPKESGHKKKIVDEPESMTGKMEGGIYVIRREGSKLEVE